MRWTLVKPLSLVLAVTALAAPRGAFASAPDVSVEHYEVGGSPVVVVRPKEAKGPLPLVVLIAGLGELARGAKAGAAGHVERYGLVPAYRAVLSGRLDAESFQGLVTGDDLEGYRQRLACGFGGLVLVGVAAPVDYSRRFERYVTETVVPWAERTLNVVPGRRGIDGISLGARHALILGLGTGKFDAVGTQQAAVRRPAAVLRAAPRARAGAVVNLLTSTHDPFRPDVLRLGAALAKVPVSTEVRVLPGRHDKRFAKGPAMIDLLLFHDGVLRGRCRGAAAQRSPP